LEKSKALSISINQYKEDLRNGSLHNED